MSWTDDDEQRKASDPEVGVLDLGVLGMDAALKLKAIGLEVAGCGRSEGRNVHCPDGLISPSSYRTFTDYSLPVSRRTPFEIAQSGNRQAL